MNQLRDGGPVYPNERAVNPEGMSLRDHYAGQLLANPWLMESLGAAAIEKFPETTVEENFKILAVLFFQQAQAMVDEKYRLDKLDAEGEKK